MRQPQIIPWVLQLAFWTRGSYFGRSNGQCKTNTLRLQQILVTSDLKGPGSGTRLSRTYATSWRSSCHCLGAMRHPHAILAGSGRFWAKGWIDCPGVAFWAQGSYFGTGGRSHPLPVRSRTQRVQTLDAPACILSKGFRLRARQFAKGLRLWDPRMHRTVPTKNDEISSFQNIAENKLICDQMSYFRSPAG